MRLQHIAFLACLLPAACLHAAEGQTRQQELATTLLAGLRSHAENIRSGIVNYEVRDQDGVVVEERFVAFDDRTDSVRSDVEVSRVGRPVVRTIQTKEEFLHFVELANGGVLTRRNVGEQFQIEDGMPIDVRAIGFCEYFSVKNGGTAEDALKALEQLPLVDAVMEEDIGLIVLVARRDDMVETHIACWIDTANGYVPIRKEVRYVPPLASAIVAQEVETSWGEINNTWVPIKATTRFLKPDGAVWKAAEVRLTWKSVNEEVPAALFTEEDLRLPNNTYILDARLGEPIVERVVGLDRPLPAVPTPSGTTRARVILAGTGLLLLLLISAWLFRRRKRQVA